VAADVSTPSRSSATGHSRAAAPVCAALYLLIHAGVPSQAQRRSDYLAPPLRSRVESLKEAVAREATAAATLEERAALLWDWANAFALDGGNLPVNLPSRITEVGRVRFFGEQPSPALLRDLDRFVAELALKEERPDAIGTLRFRDQQSLVAGSFATVEQTYTVGSEPLRAGSALLLGAQMVSDQGAYQFEDAAADNYVSIRASDPTVRWEPTRIEFGGMHSGAQNRSVPTIVYRIAEGTLDPGESATVTYGDRSAGSRGWQVQTFNVEGLLLPIYVDLSGQGHFLSPRWPSLTVVGERETRSVRGFAPSIVAPGEEFELTLRSEDRWLNRPSGPTPAYQVLLDGEPWREVAASIGGVTTVSGVVLDRPGSYRFTVRSADGAVTGSCNPVWARTGAGRRLYWGETHGHSGFAEGQGSAEHYYRFGRDDAKLDFLTMSEHDALMDEWEWRRLQQLTREFSDEGRFITYLGYEWSALRDQGGHHNVLFRTPDRKIVRVQKANHLPLLYEGLAAENDPQDVLIIPHAHNAADWTRNDASMEKLVEIASAHGTFEWFGNLYLQSGFEVGFVGGSDDHRTLPGYPAAVRKPFYTQKPGLAGVWADSLTTDAVFDALRSLSAYATTAGRLILDADLNGKPMGTRQEHSPRRQLHTAVAGTSAIDRIDLVRNGDVILSKSYLATPLTSHAFVRIGFQSSSEVFFPPHRDNPRPYRPWAGTLAVEGARIAGVATPGFDNHYTETAGIDPADPNRVSFYVETRGRMDTLLLELDGATTSTVLRFHLEPGVERGSSAGNLRRAAEIPAADFTMALADLRDSRLERTFQVDQHTDRIELQVVDPGAAMDREVHFTDLEGTAPGDYYYVRVTQLDGGLAFSSPFWVGSKDPGAPSRDATSAGARGTGDR
jgi:hypothetical protein